MKNTFYKLTGVNEHLANVEVPQAGYQLPLWLRVWTQLVSIVTWTFYIGRMLVMVIRMGIQSLLARFGTSTGDPGPDSPDSSGPSGGNPPPAPEGSSGSGGDSSNPAPVQNEKQNVAEPAVQQRADESATAPLSKKKAAPQKKVTTAKKVPSPDQKMAPKKAPPKKAAVKKAAVKTQSAPAREKKTSTSKKRRGIRLNPGLDTE